MGKRLWKLRTRHHGVVQVVAGSEAAHGGDRHLAPFPQQISFHLGDCLANQRGAAFEADTLDLARGVFDILGDAVGFHQQHGTGIHRIAGVVSRFDRLDGQVVHHFQGGGQDSGADDVRNRKRCAFDSWKGHELHRNRLRLGCQPHQRFGYDAEHTFGTDEDPGQIVSRVLFAFATDPANLAVWIDHFEPEYVIRGYTVLEAMRTARVLGDVATNGAGALARRVGSKEIPSGFDPIAQLEIDDTWLDQRHPVVVIDIEDIRHTRERDNDAPTLRNRSAGETGAGSARHDRQVVSARNPHHIRHLLHRSRKHDRSRFGRLDCGIDRPVVFIDEQVRGTAEDVPDANCAFQG